ncbi:MAG TPA: molybdenum cofactor biosynthesis protein MoaE [Pseudonocardiaceae bacterium]|jgi:molybdenum cofactor synthesis domain-containing protein|nr:molybdenum cofactor biosynthesis protein MoaE [Pseudonocardiaceae bacterium]
MDRAAAVIAASNRAAAGVYPDRTGPVIVEWLASRGFTVGAPVVVPDGDPVRAALNDAIAAGVDVVITTGGTGISPTDRTPEATRAVLDYEVPGLADAVRASGGPRVPTAVLSRGVAGIAGRTLVVNLPGSTGGVADGLRVLDGVLEHAIDQVRGGDHQPADHQPADHQPAGHEPAENQPAENRPADDQSAGREPAGHGHGHGHGHAVADGVADAVVAEVRRAAVSAEPLSVDEHAALVADARAGAVVTFSGVVRDHDGGRTVRELEYVGHPSAAEVVAEVAADLAARPGIRAIAVSHRLGLLAIGDVALAAAVSADHRAAAFEVCSDLVDEVKRRLPVWKRQVFGDGEEEWVNCP